MPNVIGSTIEEASKVLKELGLKVDINNKVEETDENGNEGKIVIEQLPKKGIQVNSGTTVVLYTE